jgi:hypothetical protein
LYVVLDGGGGFGIFEFEILERMKSFFLPPPHIYFYIHDTHKKQRKIFYHKTKHTENTVGIQSNNSNVLILMKSESCASSDADYSQDLLMSALSGGLLCISIIVLLQYFPGEPFDYSTIENDENEDNVITKSKSSLTEVTVTSTESTERSQVLEEEKNDQSNRETTVKEVMEGITEEGVLKKTELIRKTFGISEEIIRTAVRKSKEDAMSGNVEEEVISYNGLLNMIVFCSAIYSILYLLNAATDGQVYRVFHGLFRTEFEALKMPLPR